MISSLLIILFTITSGGSTKIQETNTGFDWLVGKWERTNEDPGKFTIETWKKINSREFQGKSFTLQNSDTIWLENVRLRKHDRNWFYEVTQKGDKQSTNFILSFVSERKFSCENLANPFPKRINYERKDDLLYAEISGGDMKIPFEFKLVKAKIK